MDLIKKLLLSSEFDTILVIVNWLTKQVIFIPTYNTIIFVNLACLFILYVFSKHNISSYVIFDRGLKFVSKLFLSLNTALFWF